MTTVLPFDLSNVHQPEVGLVNQPGGPERVSWPLALKLSVRDPAQLLVKHRVQPVGCTRVVATQLEE